MSQPLTDQALIAWRKAKLAELRERAQTGADIIYHGVAAGYIDENENHALGIDDFEVRRLVVLYMIEELAEHGYLINGKNHSEINVELESYLAEARIDSHLPTKS